MEARIQQIHLPFIFGSQHKFVKYGKAVIEQGVNQEIFPYQLIDAATPPVATAQHPYSVTIFCVL